MKRIGLLLFLVSSVCYAQQVSIIPKPSSVQVMNGSFTISPETWIVIPDSTLNSTAEFFNDYLKNFYGFKLRVSYSPKTLNAISISGNRNKPVGSGAYSLTITEKEISINAENNNGAFYGMQTLIQLLPIPKKEKLQLPQVYITDTPRFTYRGMHLDVSRHFFPVSYIKKYIDYIALHKMNYFHWHLTDDQGWRIEIKKYPKLTQVGAWREGTIIGHYPGTGNDHIRHGGFYTQQQIKEVVDYAAKRFITVVPEIDIPGHALAMLAAYPQLGTDAKAGYAVAQTWGINGQFNNVLSPTEYTFNFLKNVLDEVVKLFPSPYIHIGGDEVDKRWWKQSKQVQAIMKKKGLKDEHDLQSYFIRRVEKMINAKGKKIIGWDEILEGGLAPNAVVMSWRGEKGGIAAAKQNHYVIMTPETPLYFNHSQTRNEDSITQGGFNSLEMVYNYDPVPAELTSSQAKYILGAQANLWSEYIGTASKVEYSIFPRMSALSEVVWSKKENRDWKDFEKRLLTQFKRYDLWAANYSKAYFDLKATVLPAPDFNGVLWQLESKNKNGKIFWTPAEEYAKPQPYTSPVRITNTSKPVAEYRDSFFNFRLSQQFFFNKATGKKITLSYPPAEKYSGDGAFTLVNGIQNEKGLLRSTELLGFLGKDCEAVIDVGKLDTITAVKIHVFSQTPSWIWPPRSAEVFASADGNNFVSIGSTDSVSSKTGNGLITITTPATAARFVKVVVKNYGEIPAGNPGSGTRAWLFVDEIEIN